MVNSLHAGYFFGEFLYSSDFSAKLTFSKNSFKNTIRTNLDPDQARHNVRSGPEVIKLFHTQLS